MLISKKILKKLIREALLLSESAFFVSHSDVEHSIEHALRKDRLDISIQGFDKLLKEIAIVESGMLNGGKLVHKNESDGAIKGIFQLSSLALKQLHAKTAVPKTKEKFNNSSASQKSWDEQDENDIFSNIKMQTIAAAMYVLWLYHNYAHEQNLTTLQSRAQFWKNFYNTTKDTTTTADFYIKRIKTFLGESYA